MLTSNLCSREYFPLVSCIYLNMAENSTIHIAYHE
uniref:Uncharacterized protein n=1 Tax=Arundo donax TaxID=35708 RepID=A0A0A8Y5S9_ARUDO